MLDQIAIYLPGILLAYTAFLVGIMSPGPNILAVIGTSMSVGRRPGTALALGVATGSFCWALLTLAGLSALLAAYASAITVIKIVGGVFLLWLAFKAFRSAASAQGMMPAAVANENRGPLRYYLKGLTVQLTNPKAALNWIAIISLGVQTGAPLWVGWSIVIGTSLLSIAAHCAYATAFSTRPAVRAYAKSRRWVETALGVFFCFAGIKLLTSR